MFEGQDVAETPVVVELGDGTTLPGSTEIEPGAMLASTFARARVAARALQPVSIRENVEPRSDPHALA